MDENFFLNIVRYKKDAEKIKKLANLTFRQLNHYSKFGKRYFLLKDLAKEIEMSLNTISKYLKIILTQIFRKKVYADTIYDMLFGKIMTSYHDLKRKCKKLNIKLLTN